MKLKLKIESFKLNNDWMLVAMVKGDVVPSGNNSYGWSGSYGWTFGCSAQVWKEGSSTCSPKDLRYPIR